MADLFQPTLQGDALAGTSFTQQGVVDTSTAEAISSFGKMGVELHKGSVLAELEGSEDNRDFVDPTEEKFSKDVLSELNLTNITAARKQKKLTGAGAAALVNSKARQLMNSHPYYASEIKSAVSEFFSGTGVSGNEFFKEEKSGLQMAIDAGVKAGWVDPTATYDEQVTQVQAHSRLTILKNEMATAKAESDLDENTKKVAAKNLSKDWFNARSITLDKELQDIKKIEGLSTEEFIVQLDRLSQDIDAEGRRDIDVTRLGEDTYKSKFSALIDNRIQLEKDLAQGVITESVYKTQNSNLKLMGENRLLDVAGVPELMSVSSVMKNLPVGLIPKDAVLEFQLLIQDLVQMVPDIEKAGTADNAGGTEEFKVEGDVPAVSNGQGKVLYKTLLDSLSQLDTSDPSQQEVLAKELGVMLSAHADGVGRYADKFDTERWDQLINFALDPRAAKFMNDNNDIFTDDQKKGLKNVIQFNYLKELLGATKAQMERTVGSQLAIGSEMGRFGAINKRPMSDLVELDTSQVSNGIVQFSPKAGFEKELGEIGAIQLVSRIDKLNKNYANRIGNVVRVSAHLSGNKSYGPVMLKTLEGVGLISPDGEEEASQP